MIEDTPMFGGTTLFRSRLEGDSESPWRWLIGDRIAVPVPTLARRDEEEDEEIEDDEEDDEDDEDEEEEFEDEDLDEDFDEEFEEDFDEDEDFDDLDEDE